MLNDLRSLEEKTACLQSRLWRDAHSSYALMEVSFYPLKLSFLASASRKKGLGIGEKGYPAGA
jgi:hypothetical protein